MPNSTNYKLLILIDFAPSRGVGHQVRPYKGPITRAVRPCFGERFQNVAIVLPSLRQPPYGGSKGGCMMRRSVGTLVALAVGAMLGWGDGPAAAQSVIIQYPGSSSSWYNTYASDAIKHKPAKPKLGVKHFRDKPHVGVKRPYHHGYYGRLRPRYHVYTTPPGRNIRGYANAPWN